jgi:hypothetical protein
MGREKPNAFVKVGSAVGLLRRLSGKVVGRRGWSVSELGGDQWLERGPRYFFAGQARRAAGGVTVEPIYIKTFDGEGFSSRPVSGPVVVPSPGVLGVRVEWLVTWEPDPIVPLVLKRTERVVSVMMEGDFVPGVSLRAAVDYSVGVSSVAVISQRQMAVAWVPLAVLNAGGFVTHLEGIGGLVNGVMTVEMPTPEVYLEGVLQ